MWSFRLFEKQTFYVKFVVATFWAIFGNIWAIFILTSGNTYGQLNIRYKTLPIAPK